MIIRNVLPNERSQFDQLVTHPIQSWAWGDFRLSTNNQIIRLGQFQGPKMISAISMTVHTFPSFLPFFNNKTIINASRSGRITSEWLHAIQKTAQEFNAIYVKFEPNIHMPVGEDNWKTNLHLAYETTSNLITSDFWFAPYSAQIDLTKSDEQLLAALSSKSRYNLNLAKKKGVIVEIDNTSEAFERYLDLMSETTNRQNFQAHTRNYHRLMWQSMHKAGIANLLVAKYQNQIITTWILFSWGDRLYYPYGASTREFQNVMANNLVLWEAIQFGKHNNLKYFDLWGVLSPNASIEHPWYGFHHFKMSYGPQHIHYAPTYDLVLDNQLYNLFKISNSLRVNLLKLKSKTFKKISRLINSN